MRVIPTGCPSGPAIPSCCPLPHLSLLHRLLPATRPQCSHSRPEAQHSRSMDVHRLTNLTRSSLCAPAFPSCSFVCPPVCCTCVLHISNTCSPSQGEHSWHFLPCPSITSHRCAIPPPPAAAAQIDYLQPVPKANVVTAAQKLNTAASWMFNAQPSQAPKLGLANCAWILDDTAAAGAIACAGGGSQKVATLLGLRPVAAVAAAGRRLQQEEAAAVAAAGRRLQEQAAAVAAAGRRLQQQEAAAGRLQQQEEPTADAASDRQLQQAGSKRHLLVPANPALRVRILADGKLRKEVRGIAGQAQILDLSTTATDVQVSWG